MAHAANNSLRPMNRRTLIYGAAVVVAVIVIGSLIWLAGSSQLSKTNELPKPASTPSSSSSASPANATPSTSTQVAPGATNAAPSDNASIKKLLQEMLRQKGIKEMPPVAKYMHDEIASGDKGRILRAFNDAIYKQYWPKGDVIPVLKGYLKDSDPFIRYLAAQDFFVMGDNEGYSTLLDMVQSKAALAGLEGTGDLRVQAAVMLAQYGQTDAAPAIYDLYAQTKNGELIRALTTLQSNAVVPIIASKGYMGVAGALDYYGQAGVQQFVPQITATFNSTQKPDVKAAAAWALATMTNDQSAINYLVQTAQAGLNDPSQAGSVDLRNEIKYLGAIQTPAAKQTLEAALSSSDPTVVQTAVVNLVYNQGGSDKAVQVIANQLNNSTQATLPWDFTMSMATQLLDNPQIQSAGQVFSKTDATGEWQLYTVERKNWSPSNWISGYVMKPSK